MGGASERGRGSRTVEVHEPDAAPRREDQELAIEEPLEIRVAGDTLAITMRTPGDDRFLALGFLYAEGVITSLADVGSVYHCGRTDDPGYGNTLEVTPAPGARLSLERLDHARRFGLTSSACGVCGRAGIDDLIARLPQRAPGPTTSSALLRRVPELLRTGQTLFARTGGVHAACAVDAAGEVRAFAEDVGRHNAVDKVVGRLLYDGALSEAEARPYLLAVSSRASFEIVQKAVMAGFSCLASVSAPSLLAVTTAEATGLTLASFVRAGRFTLYAHGERVD